MYDAETDTLHLASVLERMSGSLDALADMVHGVEHAIGAELTDGNALATGQITKLQHLDLIRQTLEDLSILSLALSRDSDGLVRPEIADKLRLAATKQLLSTVSEQDKPQLAAAGSGAVDLF